MHVISSISTTNGRSFGTDTDGRDAPKQGLGSTSNTTRIESSKRNKPQRAQQQHLPNKEKNRQKQIEIEAGGQKTTAET